MTVVEYVSLYICVCVSTTEVQIKETAAYCGHRETSKEKPALVPDQSGSHAPLIPRHH